MRRPHHRKHPQHHDLFTYGLYIATTCYFLLVKLSCCRHQEQYEVPAGVVVTVASWCLQLENCPDVQQAVRAVRQAVGTAQPTQLKEACAK